ncbi:MAG: tRNA pseudouridine synthase B [Candidatus Sumerlaeota bacterium]
MEKETEEPLIAMPSDNPHTFNGVLPLQKPKGITSHDVVGRLRRITQQRRIGHAGTLDPMAQGVLVCCLGRATKLVPWLTGLSKEYTGEMILGAWADTFDTEGRLAPGPPTDDDLPPGGEPLPYAADNRELEALARDMARNVRNENIDAAFRKLTGVIEQCAPPYSAVKVDGKKLYEYARKGERPPRKSRTVIVEHFEFLRRVGNRLTFRAKVSSGTYIRSLVHEVGRDLGCGAVMSALVRTSVGAFHIDDAPPLEAFENAPEMLAAHLLKPAEALGHIFHLTVTPRAAEGLRNGRAFSLEDVLESEFSPPANRPILALSPGGEALAIVKAETPTGPFKIERVLVSGD